MVGSQVRCWCCALGASYLLRHEHTRILPPCKGEKPGRLRRLFTNYELRFTIWDASALRAGEAKPMHGGISGFVA